MTRILRRGLAVWLVLAALALLFAVPGLADGMEAAPCPTGRQSLTDGQAARLTLAAPQERQEVHRETVRADTVCPVSPMLRLRALPDRGPDGRVMGRQRYVRCAYQVFRVELAAG